MIPYGSPEFRRRRRIQGAAQAIVRGLVLLGTMVKPSHCPRCQDGPRKIVAHHHDYAAPTDIEWLCVSCHRKEHSAIAAGLRPCPYRHFPASAEAA